MIVRDCGHPKSLRKRENKRSKKEEIHPRIKSIKRWPNRQGGSGERRKGSLNGLRGEKK